MNVTRPIRRRLDDEESRWIDTSRAAGSPWENDWAVVQECEQLIRAWKRGDQPMFLYCSLLNPHPPYWSNSTYENRLNTSAMARVLDSTRWHPGDAVHPADR